MKREKSTKKTLSLGEKAEKALRSAVKKAITEHKRAGVPMVIWRNGKVVKIPPEKL